MAFEQKDNSGVLFKNEKGAGNPKAPQGKGTAMIDGVMYWVSAWTKEGKKGRFQSLAFEQMEEQDRQPAQPRQSMTGQIKDRARANAAHVRAVRRRAALQ